MTTKSTSKIVGFNYKKRVCHKTLQEVPGNWRGRLFAGAGFDLYAKQLYEEKISVYVPLSGIALEASEGWYKGDIIGMPMKDFDVWPEHILKRNASEILRLVNMGHNVAIACSGGHGRTGTVLAAIGIMAEIKPALEDPTEWIRGVYCDEAVESPSQDAILRSLAGLPERPLFEFESKYCGYGVTMRDYFTPQPKLEKSAKPAPSQLILPGKVVQPVKENCLVKDASWLNDTSESGKWRMDMINWEAQFETKFDCSVYTPDYGGLTDDEDRYDPGDPVARAAMYSEERYPVDEPSISSMYPITDKERAVIDAMSAEERAELVSVLDEHIDDMIQDDDVDDDDIYEMLRVKYALT